jgi:hypothetical protein
MLTPCPDAMAFMAPGADLVSSGNAEYVRVQPHAARLDA